MDEKNWNILRGSLDGLPKAPSRTVRVFLSSTFSDYYIERNELMRTVFPELREHCQQKGLDFQIVDMRWGVSETAGNDHKTSQICVDQIRSCQKISAGPNFVVFLGQRYGYRPIPAKIESKELECLLGILRKEPEHKDALDLLDTWYREDINIIPPAYRLTEISNIIHDYRSNNAIAKKKANKVWWKVHDAMQAALRFAATEAFNSDLIDAQQKHVYFRSVTEEEVHHGVLSPDLEITRSDRLEDQAICFRREFNGVELAIQSDPLAKKYFEKTAADRVDTEGMGLLNRLKNDRIPDALPRHRIYDYPALEWNPKGVNPAVHEHKRYLAALCADVRENLMEQVDIELTRKHDWELSTGGAEQDADMSELIDEIVFNSTLCNKICAKFAGREALMADIQERLTRSSKGPLVIHGSSGVGRTSVVAKVVQLLPSWFGDDVIGIFRFLASTPGSTALYDVLWSIVMQMKACGLLLPLSEKEEEEMMKSSTTLANYFGKCCLGIGAKLSAPVVIVLDTVDGLKSQGSAHFMSWLPTTLTDKIKIVVSVVSGEEGCVCYETLRERLSDDEAFVAVGPLEETSAIEMFKSLMAVKQRKLTAEQFAVVNKALDDAPSVSPLLVSLMVKEARTWRSYQPANQLHLEHVVEAAIRHLFAQTEDRHGVILTSHALAYLTSAKVGISDLEMEDLLSVDNRVLQEVYWIQKPPDDRILRIPGSLWQRITYDLRAYLGIKLADGRPLVHWGYKQFIDVAKDMYCQEAFSEKYELDLKSVHAHLSDYFGGEFSHAERIKPVDLNIRDVVYTYTDTDRQIPPQPLKFSASTFNNRRLQEQPYHLIKSKRYDVLFDRIFLSPEWLVTKIEALGPREMIYDLSLYLEEEGEDDPGIVAIRHALYRMSHAHPAEFKADLCARLLDFRRAYPETIGILLERAQRECADSRVPSLFPHTAYAGECGHLHHVIPCERDDLTAVLDSRSELFVLTPDWDLTVFHIVEGDSLRQVKLEHLKTGDALSTRLLISEDEKTVNIITYAKQGDGHAVSSHVIDSNSLRTLSSYVHTLTGQSDVNVDLHKRIYGGYAIVGGDSDSSTEVLKLPELEQVMSIHDDTAGEFIDMDPSSSSVVFSGKSDSRSSLSVSIYCLEKSSPETQGNSARLLLATVKNTQHALLCTPRGLVHAHYMAYRDQLEENPGPTAISLYDYKSTEILDEIELNYTPTNISATNGLLLVHFPWNTRIYDVHTMQPKLSIKDSPEVLIVTSSLGHLFVMDSYDMGKVYNLESGALVEEWYPGCSGAETQEVRFCTNHKTGSLYLMQNFSSSYQSLIKMWRPSRNLSDTQHLPPITDKFHVSDCGSVAVGLRKDSGLYVTDLVTVKRRKLANIQDMITMTLSKNAKMVAVMTRQDLKLNIKVYELDTGNVARNFTCKLGFFAGDAIKDTDPFIVKAIQCFGFAENDTKIIIRIPTSVTDAKIYIISVTSDESDMFKTLNYDDEQTVFKCKLHGDGLFYGDHGGRKNDRDMDLHGAFTRQDVKTGEKKRYQAPSSAVYKPGYLYTWRGSPADYVVLYQSISDIKNKDNDIDDKNGKCWVIYSDGEHLEITLKVCLRKMFFHQSAFAGILSNGDIFHVSLANRKPMISYVDTTPLGSVLLMSNVRQGAVTIFFDRAAGSLTLIDMRSGRIITRYHLQGDTIGFANAAHLHATPDMQRIMFSSDGAADVAIFSPNKTLTWILRSLSDDDASEAEITTQTVANNDDIVMGAKLCSLM